MSEENRSEGLRSAIEQLKPYLQHKAACQIVTYEAGIKAGHTMVQAWPVCTCGLEALLAAETPQGCTCEDDGDGMAIYSATCPNEYHADKAKAAATPQEEAEVVGHACAHWFTQGGAAQFGKLDWNGREPQNVDELISCILSVVRVAETPQAWQFTREEYEREAQDVTTEYKTKKAETDRLSAMLRDAARHAPSSQAAAHKCRDQYCECGHCECVHDGDGNCSDCTQCDGFTPVANEPTPSSQAAPEDVTT